MNSAGIVTRVFRVIQCGHQTTQGVYDELDDALGVQLCGQVGGDVLVKGIVITSGEGRSAFGEEVVGRDVHGQAGHWCAVLDEYRSIVEDGADHAVPFIQNLALGVVLVWRTEDVVHHRQARDVSEATVVCVDRSILESGLGVGVLEDELQAIRWNVLDNGDGVVEWQDVLNLQVGDDTGVIQDVRAEAATVGDGHLG